MYQVANPLVDKAADNEYVQEVKKFMESLLTPESEESKQRKVLAKELLKRARAKK